MNNKQREKDFFNEATRQIKSSYVFQYDDIYSDDDVRDIATSLAEYGYQYAKKRIAEILLCIELSNFFPTLDENEEIAKGRKKLIDFVNNTLEDL